MALSGSTGVDPYSLWPWGLILVFGSPSQRLAHTIDFEGTKRWGSRRYFMAFSGFLFVSLFHISLQLPVAPFFFVCITF